MKDIGCHEIRKEKRNTKYPLRLEVVECAVLEICQAHETSKTSKSRNRADMDTAMGASDARFIAVSRQSVFTIHSDT